MHGPSIHWQSNYRTGDTASDAKLEALDVLTALEETNFTAFDMWRLISRFLASSRKRTHLGRADFEW